MPSMPHLSLVIVDDNKGFTDLMRIGLTHMGHDVVCENNPTRALETIWYYRPDVVLLDLLMPGVDGVSIAKTVRANQSLKRTRLVAVTGQSELSKVVDCMDAGFDVYLEKPLSHKEITEALLPT